MIRCTAENARDIAKSAGARLACTWNQERIQEAGRLIEAQYFIGATCNDQGIIEWSDGHQQTVAPTIVSMFQDTGPMIVDLNGEIVGESRRLNEFMVINIMLEWDQ